MRPSGGSALDDKGRAIHPFKSAAGIPGLKSETWGTHRFVTREICYMEASVRMTIRSGRVSDKEIVILREEVPGAVGLRLAWLAAVRRREPAGPDEES